MSFEEKSGIEIPKGTGLSKRLNIALLVMGIVFSIAFVLMMQHYRFSDTAQQRSASRNMEAPPVARTRNLSSLMLVDDNDLNLPPLLVSQKSEINSILEERPDRDDDYLRLYGMGEEEFQLAVKAPLSVYNKEPFDEISSQEMHQTNGSVRAGRSHQNDHANEYTIQNQQTEKRVFLSEAGDFNEHQIDSVREFASTPYTLMAGSIIPATVQTGINSDLPGTVTALVRRNVYDSVTGNHLLIPQGTTLVGMYDSDVAFGQSRVLMAWSRLIFPDGSSFDLTGMPGADLLGFSGMKDKVDRHYKQVFGSALLFSIFGAAGQLSQPETDSDKLTNQQIIYAAIGQEMSQTASQLLAKQMNIQPTLTIRPGARFNVLLSKDLVLGAPYA